ncbi:hypothetical protein C8A05DRAFT_36290 [Staphylotrichum tortipilum]|uniref:Uncharacterized protein n=1 Tax=Staphylotrichum tortipilum TaxID=2831512 RepID=A0AAN6RRR4_9PEZI|nr:hypothetical protein C8A05DRAFT_36290 [Staphylotrichum longicolle]
MTPENYNACHLGALPRELLDCVFFDFDAIADLARFIRTARFVYRRYEARQRVVLWRVLQNELGPVLVDAQFLDMFPYADPADWEHYYDYMSSMAVVYQDMLKPPLHSRRGGGGGGVSGGRGSDAHHCPTLSLDELTSLCRTLRQVNFLADAYVRAQLWSFQLGGEEVSSPDPSPTASAPSSLGAATAPLSPVERRRVLLAFYRRQIVSNAWASTRRAGYWVEEDLAAISGTGEERGTPLGLMSVLESWENQQIDHANVFIIRLCLALVRCARTTRSTRPLWGVDFSDAYSHQDCLADYLRANPALTEKALRTMAALVTRAAGLENDDLITMDLDEDGHRHHSLFDECVSKWRLMPLLHAWQMDRAHTYPESLIYRWERDGKEVKYTGDAVELPPFAWIDGLEGNFVNWYGESLNDIPRFALRDGAKNRARHRTSMLWRCAGFALWDRERVESLKKMEWLKTARTGWVLGV